LEGSAMRKRFISVEEVEHVAWLARIELSEREKSVFTRQLNEILAYFEKIDEAKTEDVPPTYHILDLENVYRGDEVQPSLPPEEALRNAPRSERRFFRAPRIV